MYKVDRCSCVQAFPMPMAHPRALQEQLVSLRPGAGGKGSGRVLDYVLSRLAEHGFTDEFRRIGQPQAY